MGKREWATVVFYGLVITAAVLGALGLAITWLALPDQAAVTVSFATLAMAQLWHVFNLRDRKSSFWHNDIVSNGWVWGALGLCVALIVAAVHLPGLSTLLRTANPGAAGWGVILGMSLVPWAIGQAWAAIGAPHRPGTVSSA